MTLGTRDGYMYVFGKGKSETTVTAPQHYRHTKGNSLIIKGTRVLTCPLLNLVLHVYQKIRWLYKWKTFICSNQSLVLFGNETITGVPIIVR